MAYSIGGATGAGVFGPTRGEVRSGTQRRFRDDLARRRRASRGARQPGVADTRLEQAPNVPVQQYQAPQPPGMTRPSGIIGRVIGADANSYTSADLDIAADISQQNQSVTMDDIARMRSAEEATAPYGGLLGTAGPQYSRGAPSAEYAAELEGRKLARQMRGIQKGQARSERIAMRGLQRQGLSPQQAYAANLIRQGGVNSPMAMAMLMGPQGAARMMNAQTAMQQQQFAQSPLGQLISVMAADQSGTFTGTPQFQGALSGALGIGGGQTTAPPWVYDPEGNPLSGENLIMQGRLQGATDEEIDHWLGIVDPGASIAKPTGRTWHDWMMENSPQYAASQGGERVDLAPGQPQSPAPTQAGIAQQGRGGGFGLNPNILGAVLSQLMRSLGGRSQQRQRSARPRPPTAPPQSPLEPRGFAY